MKTLIKEIYTFKDFMKFNKENEEIYELINGRLIKMPPPLTEHQRIAMKLEVRIFNFIEKNELGIILHAPIGVRFSEKIALQPDIVFILKERKEIIKEKYIDGAPDLVIEIISKGTKNRDLKIKKKIYEQFKVKEYWIVYPKEKKIEVYVLNENGKYELFTSAEKEGKVKSKLLKSFEIDLKEVFE